MLRFVPFNLCFFIHIEPENLCIKMLQVMDIEQHGVWVKYMCHDSGDTYTWPSTEDVSCEPFENIDVILQPPTFIAKRSSSRKQYFKF